MQTFTCKKCHIPLDLSIHFNYEYVKNVNINTDSTTTSTYELNAKCSSCNKTYKIIAAFPKEVVIQ